MPSGLDHGYGAPFVRLFFDGAELTPIIESFEYEYDEEGEDVCKMTIRSESRVEPDQPQWQEKARLQVIWGFIQGEVSELRTIYVQQIVWKFEKDFVSGTFDCTDKSISLKYADSMELHQNISLPGLLYKIAQKHGLASSIELDDVPAAQVRVPAKMGEYFSDFLIRNYEAMTGATQQSNREFEGKNPGGFKMEVNKRLADLLNTKPQKNAVDEVNNKLNILDFVPPEDRVNLGTNWKQGWEELKKRYFVKQGDFRIYENIPQANKTDKQILDEYAKKLGYMVDSRDDELTLKKRNFNQLPYKSYIFGGDEGSISEFIPMSKTKSHKKKAQNQGFVGWNPKTKSFYTGNANPADDSPLQGKISLFKDMYKFYRGFEKAGAGAERVGNLLPKTRVIGPTFGPTIQQTPSADNTKNINKVRTLTPFTVTDKVNALRKTLETYNQNVANNTYQALDNSMSEAYQEAVAARRANELKLNPATGSFYGDPNLKVGILVTILAVGRKYSGNYYVIKASHKIDKSGYMVSLEMVTQGVNIKATPDHEKTPGRLNRNIGPASSKNAAKKLKIKTNP